MELKKRVWEIVEGVREHDRVSHVFNIIILSIILLNVAAVILETVDRINNFSPKFFDVFEQFSVIVFSIEYLLRIWACTADEKYAHPLWGRIRFMLRPMMIVDIMAIAPFYLVSFGSLRIIRIFRVLRIFVILKVARYSAAMKTLGRVLHTKKEELSVAIIILLILLVLSSALIYYIEHEAQPEAFSSIPSAMWWSVATLTTIGYGDMHPVTAWGKSIASIIAIIGIALFALPAGILASGFIEEVRHEDRDVCPHCGKKLN